MWPLPVEELFMVGRATGKKLRDKNIQTIGDLARQDPNHMKVFLKSSGLLILSYANGIDSSKVILNDDIVQKGIGNSTTLSFDATCRKEALMVLLALTERVCARLRKFGRVCSLVSVSIKTNEFHGCSHQLQLQSYTNSTSDIYRYVVRLFDDMWRREPIRQLGVHISNFTKDNLVQLSIFDMKNRDNEEKIDQAVDKVRARFGDNAIMRGCFANSPIRPLQGGVNEGDYLGMGGYRS
jgi:DNA polymerase-4